MIVIICLYSCSVPVSFFFTAKPDLTLFPFSSSTWLWPLSLTTHAYNYYLSHQKISSAVLCCGFFHFQSISHYDFFTNARVSFLLRVLNLRLVNLVNHLAVVKIANLHHAAHFVERKLNLQGNWREYSRTDGVPIKIESQLLLLLLLLCHYCDKN